MIRLFAGQIMMNLGYFPKLYFLTHTLFLMILTMMPYYPILTIKKHCQNLKDR